mmetsp:Transcript_9357/g.20801  ORF Transcript_9357/g.20801 Transcript_9357/m.20801 type:complete len:272 (-) Transcript_9357:11-826(-)
MMLLLQTKGSTVTVVVVASPCGRRGKQQRLGRQRSTVPLSNGKSGSGTCSVSLLLQLFRGGVPQTSLPVDESFVVRMEWRNDIGFVSPDSIRLILVPLIIPSVRVDITPLEIHSAHAQLDAQIALRVQFPNVPLLHVVPRLVRGPSLGQYILEAVSDEARSDGRTGRSVAEGMGDEEALGALVEEGLKDGGSSVDDCGRCSGSTRSSSLCLRLKNASSVFFPLALFFGLGFRFGSSRCLSLCTTFLLLAFMTLVVSVDIVHCQCCCCCCCC